MPTPSTHTQAHEALRLELAEALAARIGADPAGARGQAPFLRVEVPADDLAPLDWLQAQGPCSRGYWSDREGTFELAGIGRADVLTGDESVDYPRLMRQLHANISGAEGNIRYFGGARFMDGGAGSKGWSCFRAYRFILPRFEVYRDGGRTMLACNVRAGERLADVHDELNGVTFGPAPDPAGLPRVLERTNRPDREAWSKGIDAVLGVLAEGLCEKVVLAREVALACDAAMDPAVLVRRLRDRTRHRFHFCFQPSPGAAFVSASPEHLYRREGDRICSEAIAGTRPRGHTPGEDERQRVSLLRSDKERREQACVVEAVSRALRDLCRTYTGEPEPRVLSLAHTLHLVTKFEGLLTPAVRDADILARLHPTPAVGGQPTDAALGQIARWEPFDRGWFAGPVGWVSRDAAQFAVGIRSALLTGRHIRLFSGAGIVAGSTAEEEWAEVENKIRDMLDALGSA